MRCTIVIDAHYVFLAAKSSDISPPYPKMIDWVLKGRNLGQVIVHIPIFKSGAHAFARSVTGMGYAARIHEHPQMKGICGSKQAQEVTQCLVAGMAVTLAQQLNRGLCDTLIVIGKNLAYKEVIHRCNSGVLQVEVIHLEPNLTWNQVSDPMAVIQVADREHYLDLTQL